MDRASDRTLIGIIEDNEDNCVLLRALLEEHYDLEVYSDGPSALARVGRDRPALVLLDVSLPGMDGVEVLGRLRSQPGLGNLPAIALTAHALEGDRERLLAAGFDDYVSKPIVDERLLYAAIERLRPRAEGMGSR